MAAERVDSFPLPTWRVKVSLPHYNYDEPELKLKVQVNEEYITVRSRVTNFFIIEEKTKRKTVIFSCYSALTFTP